MENKIKSLLLEMGLSSESSITPYFPQVRDRDDISVMKCERSGVLLLSRSDHMELQHYIDKDDFNYWRVESHDQASKIKLEDHERRYENLRQHFVNKTWLDIGTGEGSILKIFSTLTKSSTGVELQSRARQSLLDAGYDVKASVSELEDNSFDIITLFHVFEHFTNPIVELKEALTKLKTGGKIVIEVPHAKDFLLEFLNLEAFKKFTFWSEHLILHTRQSLDAFMKSAGLKNISIAGVQRYPLANHMHWLAKDQPGGQEKWGILRSKELDNAYENKLISLDMTDTLMAIGEKI